MRKWEIRVEKEQQRYEIKAMGLMARAWDFHGNRPDRLANSCSVIEAIGHMVKSCLGGGIVTMGVAYMQFGLLSGLIVNILLGILVSYCIYIVVRSAQVMYGRLRKPTLTYSQLAEASLAVCPFETLRSYDKCIRYAVDFLVAFNLFGSCCVYVVIMAKSIKDLVESCLNMPDGTLNVRFYVMMLFVPCVLISMVKTMKHLAPFAVVTDIFFVIIAMSTMYYGGLSITKEPSAFPLFQSFQGFFGFLGVSIFSMEGIGLALIIENSMLEPKRFFTVVILGMPMTVVLVIMTGLFAYWGFEDGCLAPITLNFPWRPFPMCLKIMMTIMMYVTFVINFWYPFELVWDYLKLQHHPSGHWFWEKMYRSVLVLVITIIAVILPNVPAFIAFIGCFCLSLLGFVIPAGIDLLTVWQEPGLGWLRYRFFKSVLIAFFGMMVFLFGTFFNLKNLASKIG